MSAAAQRTCGLVEGGEAYCWGSNAVAPWDSASDQLVATPVPGGLTFAALSSGDGFTCGLRPDGALYCFGENQWGLGDGSAPGHWPTPTVVRYVMPP